MDIKDWCRENTLSGKVGELLKGEGFDDAEQLKGLTDDDIRMTFHERHRLSLYQFVLLRRSLKELQQGHATHKENEGQPIQEWSKGGGLDSETLRTLEEEGFRTTEDLTLITSDDIRVTFQTSGKLRLQQCLALREALQCSAQQLTDGRDGSYCTEKNREELESKKMFTKDKRSVGSPQPASRSNVSSSRKEIRLLVAGSEKSGKTSTIISLLGQQAMEKADGTFYTGKFDGRPFKVVETSDWLKPDKETKKAISCDLKKLDPGLHAIVLTVEYGGRYTQASSLLYSYLKAIFTQYLSDHLIVVFTFGDRLQDKGNKIQDLLKYAPTDLRQVLEDCSDRYVIFNNRVSHDDDRRSQCTELLERIEEVIKKNSLRNGGLISLQDLSYGEKNLRVGISKKIGELEKQVLKDSPTVRTLTNELTDKNEKIKRRKKRLETALQTKHELPQFQSPLLGVHKK